MKAKHFLNRLMLLGAIIFALNNAFGQDQIVNLPNGKKVVLHDDKTWEYYEGISYDFDFSSLKDNQTPDFLRGDITVDKATLVTAVEMYLQGWRYTMPNLKVHKPVGEIPMAEQHGFTAIGKT